MHKRHQYRRMLGFTLIEIAFVIAIIGLLLGALLTPLATQVRISKVKATDRALAEVREALLGFAVTNGRLPCPDTGTDGVEDGGGGVACAALSGSLAYASLGVEPLDSWGRRFTYRVTAEFARSPLPGSTCALADDRLGLCDTGDITINSRIVQTKAIQAYSTASVAVVVSHGPNGLGGSDFAGNLLVVAAAGTDEAENTNADATFVSRVSTPIVAACSETVAGTPLCEFDDRVTWIAPSLLFNRLVTAGILP
jgi:type II secretory pathway pseudopilin PulG